jgi:hypothetical protein
MSIKLLVSAIAILAAVACSTSPPVTPVTTPYPAGLWDAHVHLTYWGEDALDSLYKYGVVGVRDAGGDLSLLKRWRAEIASGKRKGPRIYFAGPYINGPRDDSTNRIIVRTAADGEHAVDSLASLGVDFIKTHTRVPPAAYFAILRQARVRGLKVMSHLPSGIHHRESDVGWLREDSRGSDGLVALICGRHDDCAHGAHACRRHANACCLSVFPADGAQSGGMGWTHARLQRAKGIDTPIP